MIRNKLARTVFTLTIALAWLLPMEAAVKPKHEDKISPILGDQVSYMATYLELTAKLPVIVRVQEDYFRQDESDRRYRGTSQKNMLSGIHSYTGKLNARQIQTLMESDIVEYVTLDMPIQAAGKPTKTAKTVEETTTTPSDTEISAEVVTASQHVHATLGLDQIKKAPTGRNVRVAVFDSGLRHPDLAWNGSGILGVGVDFSGENEIGEVTVYNTDNYGHGTAVAGLIGGQGDLSNGEIQGVAPDVALVDVKVVGSDGIGRTSNLIQAIDWVIANQDEFDIRIANLSLGHPPIESYKDDPLCQAVRRMVEAGIVAVVSAGNLGKTAEYPVIFGGISSPGTEPTAITVGAMNSKGTITHTDDVATSYSSRGPTYMDRLLKPDLVAPGNALVCPSAPGNYIAANYPQLVVADGYLELSGSSMATAVVSGVAALMLDVNPYLNPNLVKLSLLVSAIKMPGAELEEQGNGMVNGKTAVELAKAINIRKQTVDQVNPSWTLNGELGPEEVWSGGAFVVGDEIIYSELVQNPEENNIWGEGVFWTDGLYWTDAVYWTEGVFWTDGVFWTEGVFWTDTDLAWTRGVFWTDARGVFWTDARGVFWTDARGVFWTDALAMTNSATTNIAMGDYD